MPWQAYNYGNRYLRHHDLAVWIAANGGSAHDTSTGYPTSTTWALASPWAS
ncbi:AbfB domain-containing protein [Streptosporangium sp. NBC_01639]|uniref:AbfB domain-containing protein n=1 Tax=Streptosporangium sp. NBC_01639 TaxID=2975948 RepID=UPI0038664F24|nr:AbfB domain-containing protein [Streptosporangium sp. NBC_01639]